MAEPSDQEQRFRVIRELGSGGMGTVLLVEDKVRAQLAALKRIRRGGSRLQRALKHEFRALEALRHPNIVTPYELGTDRDGLYLLMALVDGVELSRYCRVGGTSDASASVELVQPPTVQAHAIHSRITDAVSTLGSGEGVTELATDSTTVSEHSRSRLSQRHQLSPLDEAGCERLRSLIPQLLAALSYLHARGLVHRDLKPSNALVDTEGRVKLLDFGILSQEGESSVGRIHGTVAYVAPEHIQGGATAPSNDLYSLGVMLYEVVTGRLPFWGTDEELLRQHVHAVPPPLCLVAPLCAPWLEKLIEGLMEKDPVRRLSLAQAHGLVAGEEVAPYPAQAEQDVRTFLFDRESEQAELTKALGDVHKGMFLFVTLGGPSGVGKTALLDWASSHARAEGWTVLASRARFSDRVAFNAVDGLVDGLAALLEQDAELRRVVRPYLSLASALFPVLTEPHAGDKQILARVAEAIDALVAVMGQVATARGGLLILCDDLQWADADSVAVLQRLCTICPAHVALVAAVREDTHSAPFARWWQRTHPDRHLTLPNLHERALTSLIARLSGRHEEASKVAAACAGNPFLADLCGRMLAQGSWNESDAARPLERLLDELAPRSNSALRRLLALLVALDAETTLGRLCTLSMRTLGEVDDALAPLVDHRLLRAQGALGEGRRYDLAHDRVRAALSAHLTQEELTSAHEALVAELVQRNAGPAAHVRHLVGAGQLALAGERASEGAKEAEAQLALGLAAELYAIAIRFGPAADKPSLHAARAHALECSGRYLEAAEEWATLATLVDGEAKTDALLNQAKALLATSHLEEGRAALEHAISTQQEPWLSHSGIGTAVALIRYLRGPAGIRARDLSMPATVPESAAHTTRAVPELEHRHKQADRDGFLGTMVGYFDPLSGLRYLLKARDGHLHSGERARAAEVDYVLAYIAYFGAAREGRTALGDRYLQQARVRLGGIPADLGRPYALDLMVCGVRAQHRGRWDESNQLIERSLGAYEQLGLHGSFEHQFSWVQRMHVDRHRQSVPGFARTLQDFRRVASEVEDSALACHLGFSETVYEIMRGRPERALQRAEDAKRSWPQREASYQRFLSQFFVLLPRVYLGDPADALQQLRASIGEHARFIPQRTMFGGDVLGLLAMLEAQTLELGDRRASLRRILSLAERAARMPPLGRHLALRAAARALLARGKRKAARAWWLRAEALASRSDQPIDVALARHGRGQLLGGDEGQALIASAAALLSKQGADPRMFEESAPRATKRTR